ncbi:phospholipase D-like domain-containing protein [Streptomyces sp. SS7]|uniref:phospholipase D-like domain-containing protein n=1 Tax=Streptomyces sp. SS7 TaxID=3108485 RepID=UPI0030EF0DC3
MRGSDIGPDQMEGLRLAGPESDGIDDETTFFSTFEKEIRRAQTSPWLWAPGVANRVRGILPLLREAAERGVRVRVFIRDDTDQIQARPASQSLIADLRSVVDTVTLMNVMHQKIAVIDDQTITIGSLNTLSQSWTREVILTMRGGHFARKILEHEYAELFSRPRHVPAAVVRALSCAAGRTAPASGAVTTVSERERPTGGAPPGTRTSEWAAAGTEEARRAFRTRSEGQTSRAIRRVFLEHLSDLRVSGIGPAVTC